MVHVAADVFYSIFRLPAGKTEDAPWTTRVDLDVLLALAYSTGAMRVVEIGIQTGATARTMLSRIPSIESYVGIDVPPGHRMPLPLQQQEVPQIAGRRALGDTRLKVIVREGGSLNVTADEVGPADFVFIDGDHSQAAVEHDTRLARVLTRNGGVIAWHDWGNPNLGVTGVIDAVNRVEGDHICNVIGTAVVFELRPVSRG